MTKKPNKQRKRAFTADKHIKSKAICGHLNEKLKKELGMRSLSLRKGDTVVIQRGSFKSKEGKIIRVDRNKGLIYIEKVIRKKSDGAEYEVSIQPSNVIIVDVDRSDSKRLLKKSKKSEKK